MDVLGATRQNEGPARHRIAFIGLSFGVSITKTVFGTLVAVAVKGTGVIAINAILREVSDLYGTRILPDKDT